MHTRRIRNIDTYLVTDPLFISQISVTERTLNKTSVIERKPSFNRTLSHTFTGIPNGAVYDIRVSTSVPGAESAKQEVYAPPLPIPSQLKVFPEKNGSFVVIWKEVLDYKEP